MKLYEIIKLDKGEAHILDGVCVNSKHRARFLASENEEYCQCSFGDCKVMVSISYNGHNPYVYILTGQEIKSLPLMEVEEIPQMKGTLETLNKLAPPNISPPPHDTPRQESVEEIVEKFEKKFVYYTPTGNMLLNDIAASVDNGMNAFIRQAITTSYTQGRASMRDEILAVVLDVNEYIGVCKPYVDEYRSELLGKIGGIWCHTNGFKKSF